MNSKKVGFGFLNAYHEAPNTAMTPSKKYNILSQTAEIHLHTPTYLTVLLDAQCQCALND